jgi:hypothetical protein
VVPAGSSATRKLARIKTDKSACDSPTSGLRVIRELGRSDDDHSVTFEIAPLLD